MRITNPLLALAGLLALTVTGCASVSTSSPGAPDARDHSASGAPSGGVARSVEQIKESGTIKLGVFSDKAPFGYVDKDGNYAGYDIEYGNRLGKDLGVTVDYVPVEAASRVEFLESGKVDVILANFTVTPERAENVDFAGPYMKLALGIVSPKDNPVTDPAQLKDRKVVIVKGTTADTYLAQESPDVKPQKFEQYTEVTSALADGRADAWVTDNTEALAWTTKNPTFTTGVASFGDPQTIAPAVQKGNTSVLNWLNENLRTLGKEKFFHANFEKTLKPVYGDSVNPDDLVVEGGKVS